MSIYCHKWGVGADTMRNGNFWLKQMKFEILKILKKAKPTNSKEDPLCLPRHVTYFLIMEHT